MYRRGVPGDNGPPISRPEVVAAEQRILTFADVLLTWLRTELQDGGNIPPRQQEEIDRFFTHVSKKNPAGSPEDLAYNDETTVHILDKMDGDANRFVMELLRAAWERRCWRASYGEIEETQRP